MQPYAMPAAASDPIVAQPPTSASLVIFTDLDGTLRDPGTRSCDKAHGALAMLATKAIPIVLIAEHAPGELVSLQRELGFFCPFVCENGAALYVPRGYFPELSGLGEPCGMWDVIRFQPPHDSGQAIRLLISLYRACCADPVVIVGLGDDWTDRALLREVDVPVIVRNDAVDQERLRRKVPIAYVTKASGPAGWSEAILGSVGE